MKWQPIETAPKDGTLIDVWVGLGRSTDAFWGTRSQDSDTCKNSDLIRWDGVGKRMMDGFIQ